MQCTRACSFPVRLAHSPWVSQETTTTLCAQHTILQNQSAHKYVPLCSTRYFQSLTCSGAVQMKTPGTLSAVKLGLLSLNPARRKGLGGAGSRPPLKSISNVQQQSVQQTHFTQVSKPSPVVSGQSNAMAVDNAQDPPSLNQSKSKQSADVLPRQQKLLLSWY